MAKVEERRLTGPKSNYRDLWDEEGFARRVKTSAKRGVVDSGIAYSGSAEAWEIVDAAYPIPCTSALEAFLKSDLWTRLKRDSDIGTLVEFGCGDGKKLCAFIDNMSDERTRLVIIAADANETLLEDTKENIEAIRTQKRLKLSVAYVRAEFRQLKSILTKPDVRTRSPRGKAVFLLLGGTFGNFETDDAIALFRRNARIGDFIVLSMELMSLDQRSKKSIRALFGKYWKGEYKSFFNNAASNLQTILGGTPTRAVAKARLHRPRTSERVAVLRITTRIDGREIQIGMTSRYSGTYLKEVMKRRGFELLGTVCAPKDAYFNYILFERVR